MENIIKELYWGNIHPVEKPVDKGSEYAVCQHKINQIYDELNSCMGAEEQKKFSRITELQMDSEALAARESFVEGFRLGAKITAAVYIGYGDDNVYEYKRDER
ncbi:MAG: hypothetical protein BGN88_11125 [Clostridiales bacterium 43-6]|mgnify:CR=1 FL=1|nr:MAG: hypothetical protein BGN88_11125 [Clostridiales bacterium 43-6]